MKYGFWGIGIVAAGLIGIGFIAMFQNITLNDQSEYYVLKEAMEAAMLESVDIACYRDSNATGCGEVIKISEQKFVENFTRRFVENISGDVSSYELEFYDIIESPPKASVIVKGVTNEFGIMVSAGEDGSFDITNGLNGILEYDSSINKNNGGISITPITNDNSNINSEINATESPVKNHEEGLGKCEDCENEIKKECPDCNSSANSSLENQEILEEPNIEEN